MALDIEPAGAALPRAGALLRGPAEHGGPPGVSGPIFVIVADRPEASARSVRMVCNGDMERGPGKWGRGGRPALCTRSRLIMH